MRQFKHGGWEHVVLINGKQYPLIGAVPPVAENGTEVVVDDIWPGWGSLASLADDYMNSGNYTKWERLRDMSITSARRVVKWYIYPGRPPITYP